MSKRTKRDNQRYHAEVRCFERFGFVLDVEAAIRDIQTGKAIFLQRQSARVTWWRINQQNTDLDVVYDNHRKMIATVLPKEEDRLPEEFLETRMQLAKSLH